MDSSWATRKTRSYPSVILTSMPILALIFDLGGVLLRTADFSPRERIAARFGMSRTELETLIFGDGSGGSVQTGAIRLEDYWQQVRKRLDCSEEEFKRLIHEFFAEDELDADLVEYIRRLHVNYKTALLSNATADLRKQIAEKWHFEDAFDLMVISGEVGLTKPEQGIFELALVKLGVEASQAVFVDDMSRNVEGARRAGLHAIQFRNPQQLKQDLDQLLSESQG
jgi:epoxide hydrolase-like predicted phosphatase